MFLKKWKKRKADNKLKRYFINGKSLKYMQSFLIEKGETPSTANEKISALYKSENHLRLLQSRRERNFALILLVLYIILVLLYYYHMNRLNLLLYRGYIVPLMALFFLRNWIRVKIEDPKFKNLS